MRRDGLKLVMCAYENKGRTVRDEHSGGTVGSRCSGLHCTGDLIVHFVFAQSPYSKHWNQLYRQV